MTATLDLRHPFAGRWLVQTPSADRVPSHGTHAFASAFTTDFVPVGRDARTAPIGPRTWLLPEPANRFPGFGRRLVHVQAIDDVDPRRARAVPVTFGGSLPRNGSVVHV